MFWNVFGELLLFWCSTANITGCLENTNLENADLENADLENTDLLKRRPRKHPGGGTWVFWGWVCAARDSKLATRSKKISPKIDTPF